MMLYDQLSHDFILPPPIGSMGLVYLPTFMVQ